MKDTNEYFSYRFVPLTKSSNTFEESYLVLLEHVCFAEGLHSIDLARVQLLDKTDLSKGTLPNHLHGDKVIQAQTCTTKSQKLRFLATKGSQLTLLTLLASRLGFQSRFEFNSSVTIQGGGGRREWTESGNDRMHVQEREQNKTRRRPGIEKNRVKIRSKGM
jgi:hypothetical protein